AVDRGSPEAATIRRPVAKKSRTPPPPRRVQAPARREGGSRGATAPADARRQRLILYALGGSGLVLLAIVLVLVLFVFGGTCTRFSENAFKGFRSAYRYKGPEHFPPAALNPGE